MGVQGIGVRGVPGSIPGGTTTFDDVSFEWDRLEREDSEKVLGLRETSSNLSWGATTVLHCIFSKNIRHGT